MESTLFPISADKHIIFCIIATILFLLQFVRTKRWYQLVLAVAVPCSLLIYINPENAYIYYGTGVLEGVLLLAALVLNIVQSCLNKKKKAEADAKPDAETPVPEASEPQSAETEA